jgi:tetratricopeptide (TPR) repeat protein
MMSHRTFLAVLCAFLPSFAGAQQHPSLPRDKDPNDWEEYYDLGVQQLGHDSGLAEAAFAWSSHLRPDRAEPLYGQWIAFHLRDIGRLERYLRDDERTLADPKVIRADSLRYAAFRRNPFVHQGLKVMLWDALPGRWPDDQVTRGWLSLGKANLAGAVDEFGAAIRRDPQKYGYLRFVRASAWVNVHRFDSAAADIAALLAQERAQDAKTLGNGYESKEVLEYASGLLQLNMHHVAAAREAFGRATVENAGFAPAHAQLGELAIAARDTTTALLEYGLAAETGPTDVEMLIGNGKALRLAGRARDAADQFRKAVTLEPYYAEPFFFLAQALDAAGDKSAAADAYAQFLAKSTQYDPRRSVAEQRAQVLKGR